MIKSFFLYSILFLGSLLYGQQIIVNEIISTNKDFLLNIDGDLPFEGLTNPTPGIPNKVLNANKNIVFSKPGGVYKNSFDLSITIDASGANIYYTTNGSTPTATSLPYTSPLKMDNSLYSKENISQILVSSPNFYNPPDTNTVLKCIVIRAAAFDSLGNQISEVETNSYFIDELGINHRNLAIVSVSSEYNDLFDYETGILVPGIFWDENDPEWTGNYYQRGREWEREIYVEFYESSDNAGFKQTAGLRAHGGASRQYPQKGIRLYARSDYGKSKFEYAVFEEKELLTYQRLVLKPISSSWSKAGIEDYITNIMALSTHLDAVAVRPVILYLNGEYWGIYMLQERTDERFVADNNKIDKDDIDIIEDWWGTADAGSNKDFLALYSFIEENDLSVQSNYEIVSNWINIDNFINYQVFEIFISNYDWPANNMKCWKEQKEDAKWKWIFFDGDAALQNLNFDAYENALSTIHQDQPTNAQSTLFLRKLLENNDFSNRFFREMEKLLNEQLNYSNSKAIYQKIISLIGDEIQNQIERFEVPINYNHWSEATLSCNTFLTERPCGLVKDTRKRFGHKLEIDKCSSVTIISHELTIYPNPNQGNFILKVQLSESYPTKIHITNLLGQKLIVLEQFISEGQNNIEIDIENLPEGILFVNVMTQNEIFSGKMIVIR